MAWTEQAILHSGWTAGAQPPGCFDAFVFDREVFDAVTAFAASDSESGAWTGSAAGSGSWNGQAATSQSWTPEGSL